MKLMLAPGLFIMFCSAAYLGNCKAQMVKTDLFSTLPSHVQTHMKSFFVPQSLHNKPLPSGFGNQVYRNKPLATDSPFASALFPVACQREFESLNVEQLAFISDLFKTHRPLDNNSLDRFRSRKKPAVTLIGKQDEIYSSLPFAIRHNLEQKYLIIRPGETIKLHHLELLPAVYPVACREQLVQAVRDLKERINESHKDSSDNVQPIIAFEFTYDTFGHTLKQECINHKEGSQLKSLDIPASRNVACILFRSAQNNIKNNRNKFMIIGYSDGSIKMQANEQLMKQLLGLTPEQLQFIIALYNQQSHQVVLTAPEVDMFYALPADIQHNLKRNYRLTMSFRTKFRRANPRLARNLDSVARLYQGLDNNKLTWAAKVAVKTGLTYYALNLLSSSKTLQNKNGILLALLQHRKKLLSGIATLIGIHDAYNPKLLQRLVGKVSPAARIRKPIDDFFAVPLPAYSASIDAPS